MQCIICIKSSHSHLYTFFITLDIRLLILRVRQYFNHDKLLC